MLSDWTNQVLMGIITLNDILTAGIAITAFSLFLYALSFNLRDRVARSFAIILLCVVIVFTAEALAGSASSLETTELLLRLEWFGIIFLPPAYFHFSDALLITSGVPSHALRRWMVRSTYLLSAGFLLLLGFGYLLGPLVAENTPAPYLQRTFWTEIFTFYYILLIVLSWSNFIRTYRKILTRFGRRRMLYLLAGAIAPALGSFPYLLYGSQFASQHPYLFWGIALIFNLMVGILIVIMAYAVAFFGVSWPDRVVRSRLFKWLMRGPVTASAALAVMTIVRRLGEFFGVVYSAVVPASMVFTVLILEHTITLVAPLWERLLFYGRDRDDLTLLQNLEDRFITQNDLRHLESPGAGAMLIGISFGLHCCIGCRRNVPLGYSRYFSSPYRERPKRCPTNHPRKRP
ncbi:MAG: histidine kinase N-terminal 7TM domain-containing protein [Anaerolineales bacterium]|nr:histidine kinase N-terminal 7TM domain-containing protein [Anaerolineales bacterium]